MHLVSGIFLFEKLLVSLAPVQRNKTMELNSTRLPLLQEKNDSKCQNLLQKFEGYHSHGQSFSTNAFFSDKDGLKGREDKNQRA